MIPEFSIEQILLASGYVGVFGLMIANGFISFPSSQILYIFAGYFVSTGFFNLHFVALAGAIGNTIGNIILYELTRARGLTYILKFKVFPEREVRKVMIAFNKKGAWFLFIAKLLPAIKVFAPIPAGLARMNRALYISIILVSSYIWSLIFLYIGLVFGKGADVFGKYAILLSIIALIVVAGFYKYMNSEAITKEL